MRKFGRIIDAPIVAQQTHVRFLQEELIHLEAKLMKNVCVKVFQNFALNDRKDKFKCGKDTNMASMNQHRNPIM